MEKWDKIISPMLLDDLPLLEESHNHLTDKSPLELDQMNFDNEVRDLLIQFTNLYA